jgi:hypothetical protein
MPRPDPEFPPAALLGRLVSIERSGQTLSVSAPERPWSRLVGLLLCYCNPARSLALKLHCRRTTEHTSDFHLCNLTSDLCNLRPL